MLSTYATVNLHDDFLTLPARKSFPHFFFLVAQIFGLHLGFDLSGDIVCDGGNFFVGNLLLDFLARAEDKFIENLGKLFLQVVYSKFILAV